MTILKTMSAAALAISAMVAGSPALAESTWRVNAYTAETRPESIQLQNFANRVNERVGDTVKLQIFWAGALGIKPEDSLRAMKMQQVEMSTLYAGYFGRDAPDVAQALVQGVLLNVDEVEAVLPTLQEIYSDYYSTWDAVVIGWTISPAVEISVFCKEPVNTLEELRGKKLRVWSKDQVETFTRLGVPAQIVGQNDMYVALQTGVLDCAVYSLAVASTVSLQEVTNYAAPLHVFSVLPSAIAVSKNTWETLPENIQAEIKAAADETWKEALTSIRDRSAEAAAIEKLTADGSFTVLDGFSAADREMFFAAASESWAAAAESAGGNAVEYRARVIEALEAVR